VLLYTVEGLKENRKLSMGFLALCLLAAVVLPLLAFVWAVADHNITSVVFGWNIVCFFNCIFFVNLLLIAAITSYHKAEKFGENPVKKDLPSIVVKGCPTRSFTCGSDIYTFSWYLCHKKSEIRN
jgi:hypothetical protein